ncbi:MAG: Vi polysaccharide biosynthesis protein VipA/TviB, partial [Gammaproteobacteria bacterium]|nr:Vi polysaccharide biosynthesis protein VipA/TviB [Gammaproteobacteria bacterium]
MPDLSEIRIAVVGLGYVGLPLAVELSKRYPITGFDTDADRIADLIRGVDHTLEVSEADLRAAKALQYTADPQALSDANVYVVTVPTPIDQNKRPDLEPLTQASQTIGEVIGRGNVVVFESTVFPGATEELCAPIIERTSNLVFNVDFFAGYSPERINPGDTEHRLADIVKVTSGSTPETAQLVDALYRSVITAGTHLASSIKVAEAAKVIENTQRDLNVALVN